MVTSFADRFLGRVSAAEAEIRAALAAGNSRKALHLARAAYGSEAAKLRAHRPDAGALTDAEMAASLLAVTEGLSAYKPDRSGRAREAPSPERLLEVFQATLAKARGEDPSPAAAVPPISASNARVTRTGRRAPVTQARDCTTSAAQAS
jgi:hypothetical protein